MEMRRMYKRENGSMGIGALIIFIALVLVAAIAAAVIIQTANRVRDDAAHTSDRISDQLLGLFNVISVYGERTASDGKIGVLTITTKVVSSANVDLRHIVLIIQTENGVSRLLLSPYVSTSDESFGDAYPKTTSTEYAVYLPNRAPDSPWDPSGNSYNVGDNDVVVFVVDLTQTGQELSTHTTFIVMFMNTYTGTSGKITMTTPSGFGDEVWVKIYPPE